MCTSKCSGNCVKKLKANLIHPVDSFAETDLVNKINECSILSGINKAAYLKEVINAQSEAEPFLKKHQSTETRPCSKDIF